PPELNTLSLHDALPIFAVEKLSDHPLARAIARDGQERLGEGALDEAHDLVSLTGRGVSAMLGGDKVLIGKAEMFGADGIAPLSADRKSTRLNSSHVKIS